MSFSEARRTDPTKRQIPEDRLLQPLDVLVNSTGVGTLGRVGQIKELPEPATVDSHVTIVRADPKKVYPPYLGYALRSNQTAIELLAEGSTGQTELSRMRLQELSVPVPPYDEQRAIAHILGTLDDKIELNWKMNQTLEAIARGIVKSWFVDFDPVIDNALAAGKPIPEEFAEQAARRARLAHAKSPLPENIRRLFPDEFQDSELGSIPKGWEVAKLGEILSLKYGKALKASIRRPGNVPVYGSNGQVGWHDESLVDGPGIVVGRKGNPGTVMWVQQGFFPIDTTFYVVPNVASVPMRFLFHALKAQNLQSLAADSAVPGLNRNIVYENSLLIPSEALMCSFDSLCTKFLLHIGSSEVEMRTLSEMRDGFLPHLLSGKIELVTERSERSKT